MRVAPLLTREQTAQRLNVSESTVYRLRRSGAIKEIKMGRRCVRIDPASVEAYISARRSAREAA